MKTKFYALLLLLTLSGGAQAASLSDTAQAAVLSKKIIAAYTAENYAVAQKLFMDYDQLDAAMPPPLMLVRVRVLYHTEEFLAAYQILGDYLNTAPSDSPDYDTALEMYVALEAKPGLAEAVAAEAAAAIAKLTPKCKTSTPRGVMCWLKIANHDNCYIWGWRVQLSTPVTWSGQCKMGITDGHGEEVWQRGEGRSYTNVGAYVDGKKHGQWEEQSRSTDQVWTGPYVDGKKHGHWEIRWPDGTVHFGPYVDGKRHGRWEWSDGGCEEYSNGVTVRGSSYTC